VGRRRVAGAQQLHLNLLANPGVAQDLLTTVSIRHGLSGNFIQQIAEQYACFIRGAAGFYVRHQQTLTGI
jgi:hypothetical protein